MALSDRNQQNQQLFGPLVNDNLGTIRDTNPHNSKQIENALIGLLLFTIDNQLNQSVSIQFQGSHDGTLWYNIGSAISVATVTSVNHSLADPWPKIRAVATSGVAPGSGALTVWWAWHEHFRGHGSLDAAQSAALGVVDTELPAAAALADATANPTTPLIGADLEAWNGATWDRVQSGGDNADAIATATLGRLIVLARLIGWNGATWDRLKSAPDNADALAVATAGILRELSENLGFNGTTWDRLVSAGDASDGVATGSLGRLVSMARLTGWNGTTWDRVFAIGNNGDAKAAVATGVLNTLASLYGFNGATYDRQRIPNLAAATLKTVAAVAITAGTGATIWTPTGGKRFRLMGWALSSSAAASLIFGDNAVGTVIARGPLLAAAGIDPGPGAAWGNGFPSAATNNVLKLDVTATSTISGYVWGTEE